jgi:hypothetical protein
MEPFSPTHHEQHVKEDRELFGLTGGKEAGDRVVAVMRVAKAKDGRKYRCRLG